MSAIRPYRWTGMIAFVRGRDGGLDRGRVDAEVVLADVHEDGRRADPEDRADGRVEAEARR